ncbi:hypothetical protein DMC25_00470 [Caulobacter sp. D4A]|uniref:hypothetical protein n=1 Tax=unclassified Caulobacter TaxID=2648921 RepID=UPI000D733A0C|nr:MULTISPECIES: hypothetical protein [unclassified Caulobacter]PXA87717.1 hypothetical protein DMC18_20315 [Caulobacter sp. D5]PXA95590.1 hypothetical protein DMC25_00470 [Caulobacter sp. D4A]
MLAHISDSPRLTAKLREGGAVDRALRGSPKFDDRIINALSEHSDGRVQISLEIERIAAVTQKVAFGLHALRYGHGCRLASFALVAMAGPGHTLPPEFAGALWNWPGVRKKRWTEVQQGVFSFIFAKTWMAGGAPLYCFMKLQDTLLAVVSCPAPIARAKRRLASPPW